MQSFPVCSLEGPVWTSQGVEQVRPSTDQKNNRKIAFEYSVFNYAPKETALWEQVGSKAHVI